jgi:Kef-type K+ transport system membrane component KefB
MSAGILLVLVIVTAYLATHVAYEWIARRFLIISGAEYLLLGILLGPEVSGLFSADVVRGFAPLTSLALGWVGVLVGMQFYLPVLVRVPGVVYRVAFAESLITLTAVTTASLAVIAWAFSLPVGAAIGPALALGAVACASTPSGIEMAARALRHRGPVVRQLQYATAIDALVGVVALGWLACWLHPAVLTAWRTPTVTEWAVITLAVGAVGGALFHLFLGDERQIDRLFVSVAGAVILASGTATYLQVSPLLASLVVGVILVNTSRNREEIGRVLSTAERPLYFVLLIFAGASWRPSAQSAWLLPVVAFLLVRAAAKIWGARIGTWWNGRGEELGYAWGRALIGQGGLAVALALDYLLRGGSVAPNVVFSAAIASVLLTEFAAARLVRSALEPLVARATGIAPLVERATAVVRRDGARPAAPPAASPGAASSIAPGAAPGAAGGSSGGVPPDGAAPPPRS